MASEQTPPSSVEPSASAAPALLDPAVKRSWMRASRITIVLTVVFCLVLTGLRWLDAQRQARAVGAAVVNLVDAAQGVTSATLAHRNFKRSVESPESPNQPWVGSRCLPGWLGTGAWAVALSGFGPP